MVRYDPREFFGILFRFHGTVVPRLIVRTLLSGAIGLLAHYLFVHYAINVPTTIHALIGVALGLLLVFRTNASYDRYWEGRKLLGAIVNRCRDLARQVNAYVLVESDEANVLCRSVQRRTVMFYGTLRQYLRSERDLDQLGAECTDDERRGLETFDARPLLVLQWISRSLAVAHRDKLLSDEALRSTDTSVQGMIDAWGGCERIVKTPIPFAYAHHIKSFVALFCFTLPFALVESCGLLTPVAAMIVAYAMFGIEEIGVEIEDPFGYDPNDLPLEDIGRTIEENTTAGLFSRHPRSGRRCR